MTLEGKKPGRQRAALLCTRVVRGGPSEKETSAKHDEGIPRQRERPAQRPQAGLCLAQRDSEEADVAVAEQSRGGHERWALGWGGFWMRGQRSWSRLLDAHAKAGVPRDLSCGSFMLTSLRFPDGRHLSSTYCVPGAVLDNRDQQGTKRCCVRDNIQCSVVKKKKMKKTKAGEGARKG